MHPTKAHRESNFQNMVRKFRKGLGEGGRLGGRKEGRKGGRKGGREGGRKERKEGRKGKGKKAWMCYV